MTQDKWKGQGVHWIGDALQCEVYQKDPQGHQDAQRWVELQQKAQAIGFIVLAQHDHSFEPQGRTGFLLLGQSHVSMHTWPERGAVAWDIYACHESLHAKDMVMQLRQWIAAAWKVQEWNEQWIRRL